MDPLRIYTHYNPGELLFGRNSLYEMINRISVNDIPFVVTDKGLVKSGILGKLTDAFENARIRYHVFDEIEPG